MYVIKITLGRHSCYLNDDDRFVDTQNKAREFPTKQKANDHKDFFSAFHSWADDKPIEMMVEKKEA